MGLLNNKECAICAQMVGAVHAKKVTDGIICRDCRKKLSPFFKDFKTSSVDEIRKQLEYRKKNNELLSYFCPTRVYIGRNELYFDDYLRKFCVVENEDYRESNADLIDYAQVVHAHCWIEKSSKEETDFLGNGTGDYYYEYHFKMILDIDHAYFHCIELEISDFYNPPTSVDSELFQRLTLESEEILKSFTQQIDEEFIKNSLGVVEKPLNESTPQTSSATQTAPLRWKCSQCGTMNQKKFCRNCGKERS